MLPSRVDLLSVFLLLAPVLSACDLGTEALELSDHEPRAKKQPNYPSVRLNDHALAMLGPGTPGTGYDFVVIGDPEPKQNPIPDTHISQVFRDTLAEIAVHAEEHPVDFVVVVGDLVTSGDYQQYRAYYNEVNNWMDAEQIPVFSVIGNHDTDLAAGFDHYRGMIGASEDFWIDYEDARLIMFNNAREPGVDPWPEEFGLRVGQVNALDAWLSNAPRDRFVFTHIPFHENSYMSVGANLHCEHGHSEEHFRQFHDLFVKHEVRASFAGHMHWYRHDHIQGVDYFTTGGAGGGVEADLISPWGGFVCDPNIERLRERHWLSVHVAADSEMSTELHVLGHAPDEPIGATPYTSSEFATQLGTFNSTHPSLDLSSRWLASSSNHGDSALATWSFQASDALAFGDFDADGRDELLLTNTDPGGPWMALKRLDPIDGVWDWVWNNAGDTNHPLYPYRARMIIGDFDGDDRDEVLGDAGWTTMFAFDGSDWQWGWSDYGDGNHPLHPYKGHLLSGDFDGDGHDELLGGGPGWTTMFEFDNGDWQWAWSDYGDSSHPINLYDGGLLPGDFDGDGRTELLGISGNSAALLRYEDEDFVVRWANGGSGWIGGWGLGPAHTCLAANFEVASLADELLCITLGDNASWAAISTLDNDYGDWSWGWSANPVYSTPYLGAWPVADQGGADARYWSFTLDAQAGAGLLTSRVDRCGNRYFDTYARGDG